MNSPENEYNEDREKIALGKALEELENDKNFILVIKQSFIINILMNESQDMLDVNPVFRQEALEKIQSVNYLRKHFAIIKNDAESALAYEQEEAEENKS